MNREIELELVSGGHAKLTLPDPGEFTSFYAFSTEYCGIVQFWQLLARLMAAAGRPVCALDGLRRQGVRQSDVKQSAMHHLLRQDGYGFGMLYDVDFVPKDILAAENHKLIFLRDPRDMLVAKHRHLIRRPNLASGSGAGAQASDATASTTPSLAEVIQSPAVEHMAQRYRRYAELWRRERNVTLLRYEHALSDWHATAAQIVATLKLPIDTLTIASIASATAPTSDRLPGQDRPPDVGPVAEGKALALTEIADLEARFTDVLAAFGYAPRSDVDHRPGLALEDSHSQRTVQASLSGPHVQQAARRKQSARIIPQIGAIFERDPVLQTRLKPNSSAEMDVLGRRVTMDVDATGCRPVIGQPAAGEKTFAVYGCSCTYGNAIAAEETFCSLLQGMFPAWRVENHGVPAYSTSHNLIQLVRETRWNKPELVTFCWIEHHLRRNVADILWMQEKSEYIPRPTTGEASEQRLPCATLDRDGALQMRSLRLPRHDLVGIDLSDFATSEYYLDLVCFRLFERANAIVTAYGGHFFITTLLGKLSAGLAGRLADIGITVVEASLSGREYSCLPDDGHPNALANRIFSQRIREYLLRYTAGQPAAD